MTLSAQRLSLSNLTAYQNPKFSMYTALKPQNNTIIISFQCKTNIKTFNHVSVQAKHRDEFREKYFPDATNDDDSHLGIRVPTIDFDRWYEERQFRMYANPSRHYEDVRRDFNTIRPALQRIGARVPIQFIGFLHRIHKEYHDLPRLSRTQFQYLLNNWEDDKEKQVLRKYRQRCEKDASNAYNESAGTWKLVVAFIMKIITLWRGFGLTEGALLNLAMATKVQSLWMKGTKGTNPYALVCSKGRKQRGFQKIQKKWRCDSERQFREEIIEWQYQGQANLEDETLDIEAKIESDYSERELSFETWRESNQIEQSQRNWNIIFQKAFDQPIPAQQISVSQEMICRFLIDLQLATPDAFVEQYDLNDPDISNDLEKMKTIESHFQEVHQESNYSCAQLYFIVKSICEQIGSALEDVQVKEEHERLSLPLPPNEGFMSVDEMSVLSSEPHVPSLVQDFNLFAPQPPVYQNQFLSNFEPRYDHRFSYPRTSTHQIEPIICQPPIWNCRNYENSSFNYPQGLPPNVHPTQQLYPMRDQHSVWPPPSYPYFPSHMSYSDVSPSFAPYPACTSQNTYLRNSMERNQMEQQRGSLVTLPMDLCVEKEPDRSKMDVDKNEEWAMSCLN